MEIEKMSIEEIEKYLEERKKVKPLATPENIINLFKSHFNDNGLYELERVFMQFDWTPPKQDYELELIEGMPCLVMARTGYKVMAYDKNITNSSIPFDRNLVGKSVERC